MRNARDNRFDSLYEEEEPEAGYRILAILLVLFAFAYLFDALRYVSRRIRITFDTGIGKRARALAYRIIRDTYHKRYGLDKGI